MKKENPYKYHTAVSREQLPAIIEFCNENIKEEVAIPSHTDSTDVVFQSKETYKILRDNGLIDEELFEGNCNILCGMYSSYKVLGRCDERAEQRAKIQEHKRRIARRNGDLKVEYSKMESAEKRFRKALLVVFCIALIPICIFLWILALLEKVASCICPLTFEFYKDAIEHFNKEFCKNETNG